MSEKVNQILSGRLIPRLHWATIGSEGACFFLADLSRALTRPARRGAPYPVRFCPQQQNAGKERHKLWVATRVAGLAVRSTFTGSVDRPLLAGDGGLMAVLTRRLLLPAESATVSPGPSIGAYARES